MTTLTVTDLTSRPQALSIRFCGPCCDSGMPYSVFPVFSDYTDFNWNPTKPITTCIWSGMFLDPPRSLPDVYLNLVVANNLSVYTWAWPSVTSSTMNTIAMPTGHLTLYGLMLSLYNSTQSLITSVQYRDITGMPYTSLGTPTIAIALNDMCSIVQGTPKFYSITCESSNLLRVNCSG